MAAPAERAPAAVLPRDRRRRRTTHRRVRPPSPVRDAVEYGLVRFMMGVLALVPLWFALRLGELGALVGYVVDRPHRRIGMRNLALAFPEKSVKERRGIL